MIDYGLFEFATAPGTGAGWLIQSLQFAGLGPGFRHRAYEPFNGEQENIRLSLVTHPYQWLYRIYAGYHVENQWQDYLQLPYGEVCLDSFDAFVNHYLLAHRGLLSELFNQYHSDTVLRLEDMPWALEELLECVGVEWAMIDNMRSHANTLSGGPVYSTDRHKQIHELVKAEWDICDRYEYF